METIIAYAFFKSRLASVTTCAPTPPQTTRTVTAAAAAAGPAAASAASTTFATMSTSTSTTLLHAADSDESPLQEDCGSHILLPDIDDGGDPGAWRTVWGSGHGLHP